jgi:hypothetical protein|tara:strand:- start:706 stop:966 length:261 start_codon:yes stop_codon:yes gene_type:complete
MSDNELRGILAAIEGLDPNRLDMTDIKRMKLEVINQAIEGDANPKSLEVALKAINSLEPMLRDDAESGVDAELENRLMLLKTKGAG